MKIKKLNIKNLIIFIIIFAILILVGTAIVELIKEHNNKKEQEMHTQQLKQQVEQYTGIEDFKTIEEVLTYLDSEFISQEETEEENIDYIVKAKLKYNLDINYKNYFIKLIEYSASASDYKNFYIIDEEKNINILVLCNKNKTLSSYYINNEKFYFENLESKENIQQFSKEITKTEKTNIANTCNILTQIISNNWQTTGVSLGMSDSIYKKYDIYFDEGYEIRKLNAKIYNLVFTEKYKENVVENLKVGATKEQIIEKLGEPTFETGICIGYETEKFYIFFSENQISIYPVIDYESDEIIKTIKKYDGTKDIGQYLNEIKSIWTDYDIFENGENYQILQYTLKGIKFNYDNSSDRGIIIYNNYKGKVNEIDNIESMQNENFSMLKNMYFKNENLVFIQEISRIMALDDYSESGNYEAEPIINISKKYKTYFDTKTNQLYFVSINKEYPNSELRENINYGIWYTDNQFIYSKKGSGIYLYNVDKHSYSTIIQGSDSFKLEKIENSKLYYDDKVIDL